jgi:hypothetical protein
MNDELSIPALKWVVLSGKIKNELDEWHSKLKKKSVS